MQLNGKLLFIGLLFLNCSAFAQGIGPSSGGGGAPTGAAGGGLAGTYPNPTVAAVPASAMPALTGDCTTSAGAVATTCTKTNNVAFTSSATAVTGQLPATATNDNAGAGKVGEYTSSIVLSGSAVTLTSGAAVDITTLTLTAGDWDISGVCGTQPTGNVVTTVFICNITTTLNTLNNIPSDGGAFSFNNSSQAIAGGQAIATDIARASLSGSATYHLVTQATFSGGTSLGGYGKIRARRIR